LTREASRLLRFVLVRHGDIIHPGVAVLDEAVLVRVGGKVGGIVT